MRCCYRENRVGREILPDKSLGRRVMITGDSCPRRATHEVFVNDKYVGSYCELHDYPSREVKLKKTPATERDERLYVFDVHTGDRLGPASAEVLKAREPGLPWEDFSGGVKRKLVLRPYREGRKIVRLRGGKTMVLP
jgi:hypothetical protein